MNPIPEASDNDDWADLRNRIETVFGETDEFWNEIAAPDDEDIMVEEINEGGKSEPIAEPNNDEPFVNYVLRIFQRPLEINLEAQAEKERIDVERSKKPLFTNFQPRQVRISEYSYRISEPENPMNNKEIEWQELLRSIMRVPLGTNLDAQAEKEKLDFERAKRPHSTFIPKRVMVSNDELRSRQEMGDFDFTGRMVFPCELPPHKFTLDDIFPLRKWNDEPQEATDPVETKNEKPQEVMEVKAPVKRNRACSDGF